MEVKRSSPAIVIAAAGLLSVLAIRAPDVRAADSADECVRMRQTQVADGLALAIENNCDRSLSCSLAWTVQCESATGRVTRRSKEGARLLVSTADTRSATASAQTCGDNWRIDDISWECRPTK